MAKGLILILFLLLTVNSASQTICTSDTIILPSDTTIYEVVERMPEFPGGTAAMLQFISKNLKYPEISEEEGIQSRLVFRFVVEKDGSLSNFQMIRPLNQAFENECRRIVNEMPAWSPGLQRGKEVRVYYTIPLNIHLR